MSQSIRVLIADDHPVFRQGLRTIIATDPALQIVGEAGDGIEAVSLVGELRPDIVVLDVDMPRQNGFNAAREMQRLGHGAAIIFLTMHCDEGLLSGALDLGARGYLVKESAIAEIVNSIKIVAAGQFAISPELTGFLVSRRRASGSSGPKQGLDSLTQAERNVLRLIAQAKTTKEIADDLCISPRTVENHRAHICQKLELQGVNGLLRFALANKHLLL